MYILQAIEQYINLILNTSGQTYFLFHTSDTPSKRNTLILQLQTIIIIKQNMYKIIFSAVKLILVLSAFLFCYKIVVYKQALSNKPSNHASGFKKQSNSSSLPKPQTEILKHLRELTAFPLVGSLYMQQKANELYRLGRFQQALTTVNQALQSPFLKRSFTLWRIKAHSEICLNLLEQGELSLTKASLFIKRPFQDVFLGVLFDQLEKSKIIDQTRRKLQKQGGQFEKAQSLEAYILAQDRKQEELL